MTNPWLRGCGVHAGHWSQWWLGALNFHIWAHILWPLVLRSWGRNCKQPECCNNISERLARIALSLLSVSAELCVCVCPLGCKMLARHHPWSSCHSCRRSCKFVSGCFFKRSWASGSSDEALCLKADFIGVVFEIRRGSWFFRGD